MKATNTTRISGAVAGFALLLAALVAVPVTSASANEGGTPSCYGSSCEGLDPSQTNCTDDARTILSRRADVGTHDYGVLDLRYSPACHSNWVRFTPWGGLRGWFGNAAAEGEQNGTPYIWREGVAGSLRGEGDAGHSSLTGSTISHWTEMVTADGRTCSSVEVYNFAHDPFGGGGRDVIGTYDAPCSS